MKNGGKTTFILERISSVKIHECPQRKTVEKIQLKVVIEKLEIFVMKKIKKGNSSEKSIFSSNFYFAVQCKEK
jgi:hypothetical protein